jgi:hypothetical protein
MLNKQKLASDGFCEWKGLLHMKGVDLGCVSGIDPGNILEETGRGSRRAATRGVNYAAVLAGPKLELEDEEEEEDDDDDDDNDDDDEEAEEGNNGDASDFSEDADADQKSEEASHAESASLTTNLQFLTRE